MRQYIGARYVPKFMGTYDNTQAYEALCVVDNGMGTSYIAKVPTPPNTPLTDTDYWAIYGASSGAIINLQNQIDAINNVDIPALQNADTVMEGDLKKLQRKAIYLGNSYAQGTGSTSGTDGIYKLTKNIFIDSKLYADGGIGFLTYTGHSVTFEDLLDDAIADTYFDSLDEVTDIVVISAWGDTNGIKNRGISTGSSDMGAALASFITKVKANFTNLKKVSIAFADTRSKRTIPGLSEGTSLYDEPFNAYWILKTLAPRNGIEFLGWISWETFMSSPTLTASDFYHPSDAGYAVISNNFKQAYTGNYNSAPRNSHLTLPFNLVAGSTIQIYSEITPDHSIIELGRINLAAGSTPAQYTNLDLIDFSAASDTDIVPCMPLGKQMNINNIDFIPSSDITTACPMLAYLTANSEGSAKFECTTFKATEALNARTNSHCLENNYLITTAL